MNTPTKPSHDMIPLSEETEEQVFFDGFSGMLIGPANSKIGLHQVISIDSNGKEQRKKMLTLVMPTAAIIELCHAFLKNAGENGLSPEQVKKAKK